VGSPDLELPDTTLSATVFSRNCQADISTLREYIKDLQASISALREFVTVGEAGFSALRVRRLSTGLSQLSHLLTKQSSPYHGSELAHNATDGGPHVFHNLLSALRCPQNDKQ